MEAVVLSALVAPSNGRALGDAPEMVDQGEHIDHFLHVRGFGEVGVDADFVRLLDVGGLGGVRHHDGGYDPATWIVAQPFEDTDPVNFGHFQIEQHPSWERKLDPVAILALAFQIFDGLCAVLDKPMIVQI